MGACGQSLGPHGPQHAVHQGVPLPFERLERRPVPPGIPAVGNVPQLPVHVRRPVPDMGDRLRPMLLRPVLEEGGRQTTDATQLDFKRQADPKGILNPGKMISWDVPDWDYSRMYDYAGMKAVD